MAESTRLFQSLPQEIQDWLSSESVESIIEELTGKYQLKGYAQAAPSLITTWLVIHTIEPEEFLDVLHAEFLLDPRVAVALTRDIFQRILLPIKHGLKRGAGLDIEKIPLELPQTPITARRTELPHTLAQEGPRATTHVSELPSVATLRTSGNQHTPTPRARRTPTSITGPETKEAPRPQIPMPRKAPQQQAPTARTTHTQNPIFSDVSLRRPEQQMRPVAPQPPRQEPARPEKQAQETEEQEREAPRETGDHARILKVPASFSLTDSATVDQKKSPDLHPRVVEDSI